MRVALLCFCAGLTWLAAPPPASAENFGGFYAGVNAGYAFETGDRSKAHGFGGDAPGGTGGSRADDAMPPSARDASRALQSRNRTPSGAMPLPR